jgi:membrane-bound serine protease (ClpP class)
MMKATSLRILASIAVAIGMALSFVTPHSALLPSALGAENSAPPSFATVLEIKGAIGPATSRYVVHGIEAAQKAGSGLVILEVDTPGGLDTSMRDIIRAILASPVPVATYVAPSGARAASAGTYILYASHIAAMAPATNLGAATPVSIGGESPAEPSPAPQPDAKPETNPTPGNKTSNPAQAEAPKLPTFPQPATAMERKVINDAVAYIRGLAELRGRNADWAEQAVRGAASLPATVALQQNVIDVIAQDIPDLLNKINGREVKIGNHAVKLATSHLVVQRMKPDWRTELLAVITEPMVAYGLMLIGIYGLLLEGYNPGVMLPGVAGTICLLVALFAFQILSVNYAGLALVVLGVGMMIAEFFFPTFGSLGLGGLIAFVVGSLILFDNEVPGTNIALPLIAGVATVGGLVIVGIAYVAARSLRRPVVTGVQGMVGDRAEVIQPFSGTGRVRYRGELWKAHSEVELQPGQMARIVKVDGLTLWVEPL